MGKNGVEVTIFNCEKWLNERHIEQQVGHSALRNITNQYPPEFKKQRQELQDCHEQPCRKFIKEDFTIQIIMDCRTTPLLNVKTKLGFNQYDLIMTQEQSVLSKIKTIFLAEEIFLQHNVLGYKTDAYIPKYKLAIKIDELGHEGRNIGHEIRRQKALEKELDWEFIRINSAREKFDRFVEINKIQNFIVNLNKKLAEESTKTFLTDKISNKLSSLEFKKDN